MRAPLAALLVLSIGFQPPATLLAQQPVVRPGGPAAVTAPPSGQGLSGPPLDAPAVSFERIKRQLRLQPATPVDGTVPLKLDYYVEVMGMAPEIQLFTPADLAPGPIPGGGAPTHREMIRELWTKPEFKGQSVPVVSLAIMGIMKLAQWQAEETRRRKAEAERKKRDDELKAKYPDIVVK
jgi:hypothetical protein